MNGMTYNFLFMTLRRLRLVDCREEEPKKRLIVDFSRFSIRLDSALGMKGCL